MIGAIALAISTTIGAGVLGLPKALFSVGPIGLVAGAVVAIFLLLTAYMLSDLLRQENRPTQIPALIADVLGSNWKYLVYLTLIFSMYGALSAYLLGFGEQLNVLLGTPRFIGGLLLFVAGAFLVFEGTKIIEDIDAPLAVLMVLFLIGIAVLNFFNFKGFDFSVPTMSTTLRFSGTLLFALFGLNILPEINYLTKGKANEAFTISTAICFTLYLLFGLSTVGVLGSKTTDLGTAGLAEFYGGAYNLAISLFTMFALFTSFLGIGLSLRHIYEFDFELSRIKATSAVIFIPLLVFISSGFLHISFLDILGVAGELTLPLFMLIIVYAYSKAKIEKTVPFPRLTTWIVGLFYSGFFLFSLFNLIF